MSSYSSERISGLRIASTLELERIATPEVRASFLNGPYDINYINHLVAGTSLLNYAILTERPELVSSLGLSEVELFWSRYYWLARFTREWQAFERYDAGFEQSLFQLLESAQHLGIPYDLLPEVEEAVERDAMARQSG